MKDAAKVRLTQRLAQAQVRKKNAALERADPLADAVMVYVADVGGSQREIQSNLAKLEKEKKMAIEFRMRQKRERAQAEIKRLEVRV